MSQKPSISTFASSVVGVNNSDASELNTMNTVLVFVLTIIYFIIAGFIIQFLWNVIAVNVLTFAKSITFVQALGLKLLVDFLF